MKQAGQDSIAAKRKQLGAKPFPTRLARVVLYVGQNHLSRECTPICIIFVIHFGLKVY